MSRSVFDLPLRVRRTYFTALQLLAENATANTTAGVEVRDVDICEVTMHHVAETRFHLVDLADDLLSVRRDGEHVCVYGARRLATASFRSDTRG